MSAAYLRTHGTCLWALKKMQSYAMRPLKQTDRSGRPFDVMEDGSSLARYLNRALAEPLLRSSVQPVERIVLRLTAMTDEISREWAAFTSRIKPSPDGITRVRSEQLRQFNALLEPHTWHLYAVGWRRKGDRAVPVFCDMPTLGTDSMADLMFSIIQLARAGLLDRLRKCAGCGIWFFARKPWAKFHSDACKKKTHRSTPEFKQKNKVDQRNYYRKTLSPYQRYYKKGLSPIEVRELLRSKEKKRGKKR